MMRAIVLCLMILFSVFFLTGCDTVDQIWSTVDTFLTTYWDGFVCYLYAGVLNVWQWFVDDMCTFGSSLLSMLPDYTPPSINIAQYEVVQYAAYFLPISESATLLKYLISFYITFWLGRIVLRWLKVLR